MAQESTSAMCKATWMRMLWDWSRGPCDQDLQNVCMQMIFGRLAQNSRRYQIFEKSVMTTINWRPIAIDCIAILDSCSIWNTNLDILLTRAEVLVYEIQNGKARPMNSFCPHVRTARFDAVAGCS